MDGQSLNVTEERIQQLRQIFPDVFSEGKIDFNRLKAALGEDILFPGEHYELSWAGKAEARREVQRQTTATLIPDIESSIDFDNAQNIFIEGENMEVLRVLQKSYFGKVKMIYIDPPYNTGNDSFVYPDDFAERQEDYLKRTGAKDEAGFLNKQDLWKKNTKENGQFHSVWLSMMYPRLYLSRNLMREDGIIFVSIDENEVANLRLLMDEVFGEENFIDVFSWAKSETPANLSKKSKKVVEYIICYQRSKTEEKFTGMKKESPSANGLLNQNNNFNILTFPEGVVKTKIPNQIISKGKYGTDSYEVELLDDTEVLNGFFVKPVKLKAKFKWSQQKLESELIKGTLISIPTTKFSVSYEKLEYEAEAPPNLINSKVGVGTNENAGVELEKILGYKAFDFPKPVSLLKYLMKFSDDKEGIFLDFFAGSATTAQAVLELNDEDDGNRRFILIQMPESLEGGSDAIKFEYHNIADIGKARVRKVIEQLKAKLAERAKTSGLFETSVKTTKHVLGFKSYRLQHSNFKVWRNDLEGRDAILNQLQMFREPLAELSGKHSALLTELVLKAGFLLTVDITEKNIDGCPVFDVDNGRMWIAFEKVTSLVFQTAAEIQPLVFVTLSGLFDGKNADEIMANANLQLKDAGVGFHVI